jgi:hypothetical protein
MESPDVTKELRSILTALQRHPPPCKVSLFLTCRFAGIILFARIVPHTRLSSQYMFPHPTFTHSSCPRVGIYSDSEYAERVERAKGSSNDSIFLFSDRRFGIFSSIAHFQARLKKLGWKTWYITNQLWRCWGEVSKEDDRRANRPHPLSPRCTPHKARIVPKSLAFVCLYEFYFLSHLDLYVSVAVCLLYYCPI